MSNIRIITYNNYYNRIVKREQSLQAYLSYDLVYTIGRCNFNPNDNVNTEHVIGTMDYDGSGDYCIVTDNDDTRIVSRWFIIEATRSKGGQWRIQLRRDLFVDYFEQVMSATAFIEKGFVPDTDSAIFNTERISVNQIKSGSHPLYDGSGSAWIVGYYDRSSDSLNQMTGTIAVDEFGEQYIVVEEGGIDQWAPYQYHSTPYTARATATDIDFLSWGTRVSDGNSAKFKINIDLGDFARITANEFTTSKTPSWTARRYPITNSCIDLESTIDDNRAAVDRDIRTAIPTSTDVDIIAYNGRFVVAQGKVYQCSVRTSTTTKTVTVSSGVFPNLMKQLVSENAFNAGSSTHEWTITYTAVERTLDVTERTDVSSYQMTYDLRAARATTDAPYNIFAIPYDQPTLRYTEGGVVNTIQSNAYINLTLVMGMIQQQGSRIFDVQLLPYCPVPEAIIEDGIVDLDYTPHSYIRDETNAVKGAILDVPLSTFYTSIVHKITVSNVKVDNQCDMYRLCSPNWSSIFEFSAARNGGVDVFNVSCTLKPYTPYIRIAPNFGRLYGTDYRDARGLVLSGDFSLPILIDNWQQYQINNKNYQLTFNRQIDNMEVKHGVQRIQDVTGMIGGSIEGSASGLMAGGWIGAIVGGATSLAAGAADMAINERLRNEALDYTKDQFGYSLDNIKALPNTLTRVGAYSADNTIVPILEYYTCTPEERQAVVDKIKYNGMTIMRVGTVSDYVTYRGNYIKAKLIRIDDMGEDYHVINAIAGELDKGAYV